MGPPRKPPHMRKTTATLASLAIIGVFIGSCGKKPEETTPPEPAAEAEPAETPAEEPAAEEPAADAGEATWEAMDRKARMKFMSSKVLPEMKTIFKEYNEKEFGSFNCKTCHGDDIKEVDYKMPNAPIFELPADNPIQAAKDYDEEVTAFMVDKVMPQMAELLGEEYDRETGAGEHGCLSCHPASAS